MWETTATLRLHGGVRGAPRGERGVGISCRHAHSSFTEYELFGCGLNQFYQWVYVFSHSLAGFVKLCGYTGGRRKAEVGGHGERERERERGREGEGERERQRETKERQIERETYINPSL